MEKIKKIMKAVLAAIMTCASYYGFFVLESEQFAWIRQILFIQGVVWMAVAFEWYQDCFPNEERLPLLITVEEDWDPETYDDGL